MEIDFSDNPNWLCDYGVLDAIPIDFAAPVAGAFNWSSQAFPVASNVRVRLSVRNIFTQTVTKRQLQGTFFAVTKEEGYNLQQVNTSSVEDCSFGESDSVKDVGSRKRLWSESFNASGSKACREKLRRNRLNERFLELCSILEPGKPPRMDKAAILGDAVRMVNQLRREAQKLKESNEDLQDKIKDLKAEKNELRDEKQKLKADKEKLEQQVKGLNAQPGFLPHSAPMSAAFSAQGQTAGNKLMPFIGYPGVAMWQFMPPAAIDTSQDHVLRPPVA